MNDIEQWASNLAQKKTAKRDRESVEQEKILSDRKLIRARANAMWSELRTSIKSHIEQLCKAMDGEQVIVLDDSNLKRLVLKPAQEIREIFTLSFPDPNDCMIYTTHLNYRLVLSGVNDIMWEDEKTRTKFDTDTIARLSVEQAFCQAK